MLHHKSREKFFQCFRGIHISPFYFSQTLAENVPKSTILEKPTVLPRFPGKMGKVDRKKRRMEKRKERGE